VSGMRKLNDPDYPAFTIGQAAELLEVQQPFLRSLDAAGVVSPERSDGGHRRYSRRQLETITRLRELLDQGHALAAAAHIIGLQDDLAAAHAEIDALRDQVRALTDGETP
jgi:MerR family transcriptional regulator, heat shock protein HspR